MPACATTSPRWPRPAPTASACSAPNSSSWSRRPCRGARASSGSTASVLDAAGGKPVIFRTVDVGGDKSLPYLDTRSGERGKSGDGLARAAPRARPRRADEGAGPRPARGGRRPRAPGHVPDGLRALGVRRRRRRSSRSSAPGSPSARRRCRRGSSTARCWKCPRSPRCSTCCCRGSISCRSAPTTSPSSCSPPTAPIRASPSATTGCRRRSCAS